MSQKVESLNYLALEVPYRKYVLWNYLFVRLYISFGLKITAAVVFDQKPQAKYWCNVNPIEINWHMTIYYTFTAQDVTFCFSLIWFAVTLHFSLWNFQMECSWLEKCNQQTFQPNKKQEKETAEKGTDKCPRPITVSLSFSFSSYYFYHVQIETIESDTEINVMWHE